MTELWYRFNVFAEKEFFEKSNLVDGLIVPAHVIAYYEVSFPQFLKEVHLPFLIDPVSYVWDINHRFIKNGNGELKKSYSKLVEKLNCSMGNLLGKYQLSQSVVQNSDFDDFINAVLKFQLLDFSSNKPQRAKSMQRLRERIRLIEGETPVEETKNIQPYALIPPYFYFTRVDSDAYERTLYAAKYAQNSDFGKQHKIFPCLCLNSTIFRDVPQISKILEDYKGFQGIVFWINDFDETKAKVEDLEALTKFVQSFHIQGSEVVNLYGGFFSLSLHHAGLSKLSCGICYSSSRNVFSEVGGGGLPIRYYEPTLKLKLMRENMFRLYADKPELFDCECPICSDFGKICKNPVGSQRAKALEQFFLDNKLSGNNCVVNWETSRIHFLNCRKIEQKNINESKVSDTINQLLEKYQQLTSQGFDPNQYGFNFESFDYIAKWGRALRSITEK